MNSSNNDPRDRKIQQDARAWARLTGSNYTTALRQIESPLTQGILGERVSARHLINTLDDHPLIGADGGVFFLAEAGFYPENAKTQWSFTGSDYIELALITEFLRMFTPLAAGEEPSVSSYSLKHTAEKFLAPHCTYVSNGRIIWAAAALGLPLTELDDSINVLIGVSEREHDYVRRVTGRGNSTPQGHHYRPAGLTHLQTTLEQCAVGEPAVGRWERPEPTAESLPFHDWLMAQEGRGDLVGELAMHYSAGIRDSDHRIARTAQDLMGILQEMRAASEFSHWAADAITEWAAAAAPEVRGDMSLRTERVSSSVVDSEGWGAGAGTIERHEFLCPCTRGLIVEEHDNIPGFREHDVQITCADCNETWHIVPGLPVRGWRVEPKPAGEAA
ncbi:MAG: hypothetical protein ABWY04_19385 [Arthrobacter sp.]